MTSCTSDGTCPAEVAGQRGCALGRCIKRLFTPSPAASWQPKLYVPYYHPYNFGFYNVSGSPYYTYRLSPGTPASGNKGHTYYNTLLHHSDEEEEDAPGRATARGHERRGRFESSSVRRHRGRGVRRRASYVLAVPIEESDEEVPDPWGPPVKTRDTDEEDRSRHVRCNGRTRPSRPRPPDFRPNRAHDTGCDEGDTDEEEQPRQHQPFDTPMPPPYLPPCFRPDSTHVPRYDATPRSTVRPPAQVNRTSPYYTPVSRSAQTPITPNFRANSQRTATPAPNEPAAGSTSARAPHRASRRRVDPARASAPARARATGYTSSAPAGDRAYYTTVNGSTLTPPTTPPRVPSASVAAPSLARAADPSAPVSGPRISAPAGGSQTLTPSNSFGRLVRFSNTYPEHANEVLREPINTLDAARDMIRPHMPAWPWREGAGGNRVLLCDLWLLIDVLHHSPDEMRNLILREYADLAQRLYELAIAASMCVQGVHGEQSQILFERYNVNVIDQLKRYSKWIQEQPTAYRFVGDNEDQKAQYEVSFRRTLENLRRVINRILAWYNEEVVSTSDSGVRVGSGRVPSSMRQRAHRDGAEDPGLM